MDQEKIGKFIANLRKEKGLTQEQLAEKLGVSNKSVSRWENGVTLPDVSLFKPLCNTLGITVNDLINGEFTPQKDDTYENITNTLVDYSSAEIKKYKKNKVLYVISGIIGIVILFIIVDSLQALILTNSPLLSKRKDLSGESYVDRGILINTYYCVDDDVITVVPVFKTINYGCSINNEMKLNYNIKSLGFRI